MRGVFVTTAHLQTDTGGGNVSSHELKAMDAFCEDVTAFHRGSLPENRRQSKDPFTFDRIAATALNDRFDIAFFNGEPFYRTAMTLKHFNPNIKIVASVPPHDLTVSQMEHESLGISFAESYPHLVDEKQLMLLNKHKIDADLVIYPSLMELEYYSKRFVTKGASAVIPHGCIIPENPPPMPDEFSPAYIGAMGPDKGIRYLIDAWSSLDFPEELVFYGREAESLGWYLAKFEPKGKFRAAGYFKSMDDIVPDISLGIFPTATEGFNIPALELMSYGRPVIITTGAGIHEYFSEMAVNIRDPAAIAERTVFYKENPDMANQIGKNCRDGAKRFSWEMIEKMYRETLEMLFNE
jgi:glycosyltransferase involved in cell wall biosynthesis